MKTTDIKKLQLPTVTLIAVAGNKQGETIASMYKSMAKVDFGAVKLITNVDLSCTGIEVVNVGGLGTWDEYNRFIVKELYKHFHTTHCLIVQHDSWVLNPESWDDDWLNYDIIGARGLSDGRNNFNGGFSLRSYMFQYNVAKDDFIDITSPEDEILCRLYRKHIQQRYGMKYCTDEVADKFAYEMHEPLCKTFGFHNFHWPQYRETVVIKRSHALGDVIMLEPVLHYFHLKGYQVALDTQPEFLRLFYQHYFPIVPKGRLNPGLPYKEVNLDMAYEITPNLPVLQSYYNMAGIKDGVLRNPKLTLLAGENQRLFNQKYAVIHINYTNLPYRNAHGIKWTKVVDYLKKDGYLVFQIGRQIDEEIGTYFNTMTLEFMMFFVKGASLFIGSDSGPSHIAVGFDVPSVIMFGSVDPKLRHNNLKNISIVQSECPKAETKNCYHKNVDVVGSQCVYNEKLPPCTMYSSEQIIEAVKSLSNI